MVDPTSQEVHNAVHDWTYGEMRYGRVLQLTPQQVKVYIINSLLRVIKT